jgi:hypothetical protein
VVACPAIGRPLYGLFLGSRISDTRSTTSLQCAVAMERVSVAVFGSKAEGGFGDPWCMALVNGFQFASESAIEISRTPRRSARNAAIEIRGAGPRGTLLARVPVCVE